MSELSQEQIDALLRGAKSGGEAPAAEAAGIELSQFERDTIGELGNISMGSGATTLSMILNKSVTITAPDVTQTTLEQLSAAYAMPSVLVQVKYTVGLEHANLFMLHPADCAVICDLMMGGDGSSPSPEIGEMQLSAVGEAMNQMMGTAATAMSTFFSRRVDISPPKIEHVAIAQDAEIRALFGGEALTQIAFTLVVEGLIESTFLQVMPTRSVKKLVEDLVMAADNPEAVAAAVAAEAAARRAQEAASPPAEAVSAQATVPAATLAPSGLAASGLGASQISAPAEMIIPSTQQFAPAQPAMAPMGHPYQEAAQAPPQGYPPAGYPPAGYPPPGYPQQQQPNYQQGGYPPPGYPPPGYPPPGYGYPQQGQSPFQQDPAVAVKSASFAPLSMPAGLEGISGLDLIMDVPLRVTVELGRTRMQIRDVLDLGKGSVVELDKLAGEPVDMLVNGKLIAKGEVVVIDENFGIRVTDIVSPIERFNNLKIQ
jgi:flagellar motor switch protein FliN/FliY